MQTYPIIFTKRCALANSNRTIRGPVKPTTLDGWPKKANVAASEALQGKAAKTPETFAGVTAVVVDQGIAKLAARKVAVTESAILEQTPISTASIVQTATAIDEALPIGTFEPKPAEQSSYMPTWNAHVKVRK